MRRAHFNAAAAAAATPPPPLLVGDWRFQTTKNNAKETLPKKPFILSKLYQISEGKEKITIFLLFP